MNCKLRKSDWLDDWMVLEKTVPSPYYGIPEGAFQEWLEVAAAYQRGEARFSFRRVGFYRRDGSVTIYSPHNSDGEHDITLTSAEADEVFRQAVELASPTSGHADEAHERKDGEK